MKKINIARIAAAIALAATIFGGSILSTGAHATELPDQKTIEISSLNEISDGFDNSTASVAYLIAVPNA